MVKFLWDECIPHDFIWFIYKGENYGVVADPKLTYQKANKIVTNWLVEDKERINLLKNKLEENFKYVHYIHSSLFPKIYNRINNFGIQNKGNFQFKFSLWKLKKQNGEVEGQTLLKQQSSLKTFLHTAKNPANYKDRKEANPHEQASIAPNPYLYKVTKSGGIVRRDGSAKQTMDLNAAKKRAERAESLKRQLAKNTAKMNMIKKQKVTQKIK